MKFHGSLRDDCISLQNANKTCITIHYTWVAKHKSMPLFRGVHLKAYIEAVADIILSGHISWIQQLGCSFWKHFGSFKPHIQNHVLVDLVVCVVKNTVIEPPCDWSHPTTIVFTYRQWSRGSESPRKIISSLHWCPVTRWPWMMSVYCNLNHYFLCT